MVKTLAQRCYVMSKKMLTSVMCYEITTESTRSTEDLTMMAITGLGLAKVQTQKIEAGHTYYIGASDSPKLLLVLAMDEKRVTVVNPWGETMKSYTLDRRSTEDLAARGGKVWTDRLACAMRSSDPFLEGIKVHAAAHGTPAKPRDFDIYAVSLRPVSGKWDNDQNWRAAEEYGNVGGCTATELLDVTRVRGSGLARLMTDERFVVVKVELVEECPRA
jgi:hypothetical protein